MWNILFLTSFTCIFFLLFYLSLSFYTHINIHAPPVHLKYPPPPLDVLSLSVSFCSLALFALNSCCFAVNKLKDEEKSSYPYVDVLSLVAINMYLCHQKIGEAEVVPTFKRESCGFLLHYERGGLTHKKRRNTYRIVVLGSHWRIYRYGEGSLLKETRRLTWCGLTVLLPTHKGVENEQFVSVVWKEEVTSRAESTATVSQFSLFIEGKRATQLWMSLFGTGSWMIKVKHLEP